MDTMSMQNGPRRPSGPRKPPQASITSFWSKFIEKTPSKVTSVFPPSLYADLLPPITKRNAAAESQNAAASYDAAAKECRERVAKIVRECHRTNEKFTDSEFDLEGDFEDWNCLNGLLNSNGDGSDSISPDSDDLRISLRILLDSGVLGSDVNAARMNLVALHRLLAEPPVQRDATPGSVHRVDWIYDNPQFCVDGYSNQDVRQGANGDCWFLAAIATLCSVEGVVDKVCVAKDEECGVYGFVFFRDGEWIWTVIDDNLYLAAENYPGGYDPSGDKERRYKKQYQTGSEALFFAKSSDQNETWLPLLEKAFAKAHGDYEAISGGDSGEGVEDMTGGVTTRIANNKILSKNRLWNELLNEKQEFLFAASSHSPQANGAPGNNGVVLGHAFSILKAVEEVGEDGKSVRLVKIRNPWGLRTRSGFGEWEGAWADGSKEMNTHRTPFWLTKLKHTAGDDGIFWMAYEDLLKHFESINRTKLFDNEWNVVQKWTSISVSWVTGYQKNKFTIKLAKDGQVVIVLSQLNTRYFVGLEGQYEYSLHFILRKLDGTHSEEIVRARDPNGYATRSISAEIDLEAGDYEVIPKIQAYRIESKPYVEDVVKKYAEKNPQKLRQIGINHDVANAKGIKSEEKSEDKSEDEVKKVSTSKVISNKGEPDKKNDDALKKEDSSETATESVKGADEKDKDNSKEETKKTAETTKNENSEKTSKGETDTSKSGEMSTALENKPVQPESSGGSVEEKDEAVVKVRKDSKKKRNQKQKSEADNEPAAAEDYVREDEAEREEEKDGKKGVHLIIRAEESDDESEAGVESPWNAVCVIGVRVYSKDPGTIVDIAESKDADASSLTVADHTAAGATS